MSRSSDSISLLIVTPCSATKAKLVETNAAQQEFWSKQSTPQDNQLAQHGIAARDLYQGAHHKSVMATVDKLRAKFCDAQIEIAIISAGYGLVKERDRLTPYDKTFDRMSPQESQQPSERLSIRPQLNQQLSEFKFAIFLLSAKYLHAIEAPLGTAENEIYFAGSGFNSSQNNVYITRAGTKEAKSMGVSPRMAKAELFRRFANSAIEDSLQTALKGLTSKTTPMGWGT